MLSSLRVPLLWSFLVVLSFLANVPNSAPAQARDNDRLSRHRDRLGVTGWHSSGYLGQGVKVAVLDSDFSGYKEECGETLPGRVRTKSFRKDGNLEVTKSGHGLRAAQVIHALAPRAELLLINWEPSSPEHFFDAVRWAKAQGARIISCSVTASIWGDGEGGGPHHKRLTRLLGKGDRKGQPLFFCSAGNTAYGHWSGAYQVKADRLHQWKRGVVDNVITPDDTTPVRVSLMHKPGTVYQMQIYEGEDDEPLAQKISELDGSLATTVLTFRPKEGEKYRLRLRLVGGKPAVFHCVARPARLLVTTLSGSICCFPADNPSVVTVGAVDWFDRRTYYSACGRSSSKPEVVAPVPFPCPGREEGFHGTSAAAPQAAAVAALLAEKQPSWKAEKLREALLAKLRPIGKGGSSSETGRGRLWLPRPGR